MEEITTKGQRQVSMLFACELAYGRGGGSLNVYEWQRPENGLFHHPRTTLQGQNKL